MTMMIASPPQVPLKSPQVPLKSPQVSLKISPGFIEDPDHLMEGGCDAYYHSIDY